MNSYKWNVIIDPVGLRSRFKIGDLVQHITKSDGSLSYGSWISYGDIGIVKEVQFFKRELVDATKEETQTAYPSIICEVNVFWMNKNQQAWVIESLLQPLER